MRALDYHESTKHSWERIRANPHSLDFANMPHPFKIYIDLARQPLSTDLPDSAVPALAALAEPGVDAGGDRVAGRNELAHLLFRPGLYRGRRIVAQSAKPAFATTLTLAALMLAALLFAAQPAMAQVGLPIVVSGEDGDGRVDAPPLPAHREATVRIADHEAGKPLGEAEKKAAAAAARSVVEQRESEAAALPDDR